jgi:acetoacetate decarboxylase
MHREATADEMPAGDPMWRLKVIPRVDGAGLDVMQLIDLATTTTDQVIHVCRSGDGVVQFNPSPIYDLSGFAPLEYFGAYYLEMDMTEGWGEIVKDFLAD